MLYFTGSHLFPHFIQGKELLCLIVENHLRNNAAHDGPHGHFCRGPIELMPLRESLVAAPRRALVLCQLWESCSLISIVSLAWLQMRSLISGCLEEGVLPSIHSFVRSFRVTCSGCLFGPPSHTANSTPLRGEKVITVKIKFAFLQLSCTWELFEISYAGNSLFWFCIQWTGKSMANFLCTIHSDRGNLLKLP